MHLPQTRYPLRFFLHAYMDGRARLSPLLPHPLRCLGNLRAGKDGIADPGVHIHNCAYRRTSNTHQSVHHGAEEVGQSGGAVEVVSTR